MALTSRSGIDSSRAKETTMAPIPRRASAGEKVRGRLLCDLGRHRGQRLQGSEVQCPPSRPQCFDDGSPAQEEAHAHCQAIVRGCQCEGRRRQQSLVTSPIDPAGSPLPIEPPHMQTITCTWRIPAFAESSAAKDRRPMAKMAGTTRDEGSGIPGLQRDGSGLSAFEASLLNTFDDLACRHFIPAWRARADRSCSCNQPLR